jgi:hypothetical protein
MAGAPDGPDVDARGVGAGDMGGGMALVGRVAGGDEEVPGAIPIGTATRPRRRRGALDSATTATAVTSRAPATRATCQPGVPSRPTRTARATPATTVTCSSLPTRPRPGTGPAGIGWAPTSGHLPCAAVTRHHRPHPCRRPGPNDLAPRRNVVRFPAQERRATHNIRREAGPPPPASRRPQPVTVRVREATRSVPSKPSSRMVAVAPAGRETGTWRVLGPSVTAAVAAGRPST